MEKLNKKVQAALYKLDGIENALIRQEDELPYIWRRIDRHFGALKTRQAVILTIHFSLFFFQFILILMNWLAL